MLSMCAAPGVAVSAADLTPPDRSILMMYLFLICDDPRVPLGPDDPPSLQQQHAALSEQLSAEGRRVFGGAPHEFDAATVVRVRGTTRLPQDGPYAETKEVVGGYYIVECKDDADAESVGMRIPVASQAWVQIRPLWIHDSG
jgi:hypothetical protein